MKQLCYKKGFKSTGVLLQGIFAGILLLCLMNIFYWTEGSFSVREMGKSFEETELFFRQVEEIVHQKLTYERNKELFERNGQFHELQEVDIRQYETGALDEANLNLNTTYYIRDLLLFAEDGLDQMEDTLEQLMSLDAPEEEVAQQLDGQSQILETILPISGSSLAEFARINTNAAALLEYYQELCSVSKDISKRYQQYQLAAENPESEENSEAPSNVKYYIENTNTKQRYTNMGVKSLSAARRMVQNSEELVLLFEGERRFNIMVSNSDSLFSQEAAVWFIGTRFISSGEKVFLSVNTAYPIGDSLQEAYHAFEKREPLLLGSVIAGSIAGVFLAVFLILSVIAAGRSAAGAEVTLNWFDRIPTEISAGICLICAIIWYFFVLFVEHQFAFVYLSRKILLTAALVMEYWIFLFSFLSLIRRVKKKSLWSNSVCYVVVLGCRQVYSAKQSAKRLLISYVLFFALNIFFIRFFGSAGVLMTVVMDMAVLLSLMRSEVGKQSIREGLYQISQGKLDYKVDTKVLTGETLEMAEAVNEMGEGLQSAVDSMLKNERLKAELITNVSHDIKTPLTSIINYVDLLKRENLQNPCAEEYLLVLEQKSQRLKQLTEDLIEASKINSGNVELQRAPLKLQQILQQAYGEFAERLEEKKLETVMQLEKEPVVAFVDGLKLWRVFENLLGNIVKYAMPGTRVYLEVRRDGPLAVVEFKNVSRQKLEIGAQELQERFVRGDLSRSTEGSGLGLSIAKSLTELMDGSFQVYVDGDLFQVSVIFPVFEE